ncbi:MAG TPA: GxGYxYP family putative glycoside hydrolase [Anaerolineae bacterium]|nr:GxGYxYP family putative glycoside hydrolase [Anaerolineae bacterium]
MDSVALLDVAGLTYPQQLAAASLQGLANRAGPRLYLDWGIYDDVRARTTNEIFLPEEIWQAKYRAYVGDSDLLNLSYYREAHGLQAEPLPSLTAAVQRFAGCLRGLVVWDPTLPDSANAALMLAGLESLLVVSPDLLPWAAEATGLPVRHDLRGRWSDRVGLYEWALAELFPRCAPGQIACIEPGWHRPEFADYLVQRRLFAYSLSSHQANRACDIGQKLLLLLVAGPWGLRNTLFALRLDGLVRRLGLALMACRSAEVRLATRMHRAVTRAASSPTGRWAETSGQAPFPTIFGWHTQRDDELAFMVLLSANGLRLVPSHLASNFSFHSQVPIQGALEQDHARIEDVRLEPDKVYLTFTLSDGDQLVLMGTAELGNWRREERGSVPFNWETQPLLGDLAPALLARYYRTRTPADYLIAGPSGAGYVIPPLVPDLDAYLHHTREVCRRAGIRVLTSYIADPPRRVVRAHARLSEMAGFLAGYVHFGRTPHSLVGGTAFVANAWPHVSQIWADSTACLAAVRALVEEPGPAPRFVGVHLSAYTTTITDVSRFVATLDPQRVKVVRADEFLLAAAQHLSRRRHAR